MSGTAPSKSTPAKSAEVQIDRLVLDIPGLDQSQAAALAADVAERLASSGLPGQRARIGVTLGAAGGTQGELAARIAAAIMQRLL